MAEDKEILLTEEQIIALADMITGQTLEATAERIGKSKASVSAYRNKIRKFMKGRIDVQEYSQRMFGFLPQVVENLAYFLVHRDKEITLKMAAGFGLLPKDMDELKELLRSVNGVGAVAGTPTVNITQYFDGKPADTRDAHDRNIAAIFQPRTGNRFTVNSDN